MILFTLGALVGFAAALVVPPLLGVAKEVVDLLQVGSLGDQPGTR
jgi:hypothetical protein